MTLVKRKIDLTFSLGEGSFGEQGANTVTISGLRTSATITRQGQEMAQLQLRVWGMPLDTMRKLTVLNKLRQNQERRNTIVVSAGDDVSGTAVVFSGNIIEAWADAQNAPDVLFVLSAFEGVMAKTRPIAPTSFSGPVQADVFFSSLAAQITDGPSLLPYGLENWGVVGVLDNPYYPGTALDQITKAASALNINAVLDSVKGVLAIWPKGQSRGESTLDVSAATGLVGYPQFTQNGVAFTTLLTPSLFFGQRVRVTSILDATEIAQAEGLVSGEWVVAALQHNLDAEIPNGQWFTRVECGLLGGPVPILSSPS